MQMEMFMKESGKMTKHMDSESTITLMEHVMKVTGVRISSMDTARRHGQMALVMRVNIKMEKRMDSESLTGLTIRLIRDNSLITIYME